MRGFIVGGRGVGGVGIGVILLRLFRVVIFLASFIGIYLFFVGFLFREGFLCWGFRGLKEFK